VFHPGSVSFNCGSQIFFQPQEPILVLLFHVVDVPLAIGVDDLQAVTSGVSQAVNSHLSMSIKKIDIKI
jgi:hypothetical protein